eukprot:COSAG01_NODE_36555_length_516_cov_0.673861_1_plen_74_part_10
MLEPDTSALGEPFQALATKHLRYMHLAAAAVQHRQPAAAAAASAEPGAALSRGRVRGRVWVAGFVGMLKNSKNV